MFIGHFGAGLAAKKLAPRASLGTLFFAAQFLDLLWPILLLTGAERVAIKSGPALGPPLEFTHYPISHSLATVLLWALILGAGYFVARRYLPGALAVGALAVSHWLLDLIVHQPDLPLYPGGPLLGLGLWNLPAASLVLEFALFGTGLFLYHRRTRAKDRVGSWGLWGLAAFLLGISLANVYGPPAPSVAAVAWAGQAQWLLVAWGWWVDRHRAAVGL